MNPETGHHAEPPPSGHKWFDITIAVCILLVSVSSLIVAVVHSETLEKMAEANSRLVEANSWPYLGYGTGNSEGPNDNTIEMRIANNGVGPAKLETAELKWNGKAQRTAADFLQACCGYKPDPGRDRLWRDLVTGRVLRAGETISFITLFQAAGEDLVWERLNHARLSPALSINICYCSVFDECWTEDVLRMSLTPRHVERCTTPKTSFEAPTWK
ncbi:MAG TPA: hypothetical protein VHU23_18730 [Rhizomicrobium sp.]|nr:hypothetical protein [Rhizomicrobium sp.]